MIQEIDRDFFFPRDAVAESLVPYLLPEKYSVWAGNGIICNRPFPGAKEYEIPVFNDYQGVDGGYIALYTRDPEIGHYSVGDEGGSPIYVMGMVRVPGFYVGRILIPTKGDQPYQFGDDITRDETLLETCRKYFPDVVSDFWVGGDTGGFL